MDTPTSPERAIFEDPLLRDVVALAMPALVSAGDLLSIITLELTACIHSIPHDFSAAWKSMTTSSIADFIFACARGYNLDLSGLLELADEITESAISFTEDHPEPKNRAWLKHILRYILDTMGPSGAFEPSEPRIPDMDFESEAYYQWQEEMLDEDLRRAWEEQVDEAWHRKEMINRWKFIVEKSINFATSGPAADFNFERCRSQSC